MGTKRIIQAREIVRDIRLGRQDAQIMTKYRLSPKGLESVYRKLIQAKVIDESDLQARSFDFDDTAVISLYRQYTRNYLILPVHVSDPDRPADNGLVEDISENGLKTIGIPAEVGQRRNLLICADDLDGISSFACEAECRWTSPGDSEEDFAAGHQITNITLENRQELTKLIEKLSIGSVDEDSTVFPESVPSDGLQTYPETTLKTPADPESVPEKGSRRIPSIDRKYAYYAVAAVLLVFLVSFSLGKLAREDYGPALITAAARGDLDEVKVLLFNGANVNSKTGTGTTSLMWAAYNGHKKIARALLKAGADVDSQDVNGNTALILASTKGRRDTVRLLLDHGAKTDHKSATGYSAAMWADRNGHTALRDELQELQTEKLDSDSSKRIVTVPEASVMSP